MATYYVSTSGVDSSSRTGLSSSQSWASLSYACSRVTTSSNEIFISNGIYYEGSRCNLGVGIDIRGESQSGVVINFTYVSTTAANGCLYLNSSSLSNGNQSVGNFTMRGNMTAYKAIWIGYRNNVEIYNVTVEDFLAAGVHFKNQINWETPPTVYATGNSIHDCTINDCADRNYESLGFSSYSGNIRMDGQEDFEMYNCYFNNTGRSTGHNGNILCTCNTRGVGIHDCTFVKPDSEGTQWNFYSEIFHSQGGFEVYDCTFLGSACLDFSNKDDGTSSRGSYDFTYSVHDNTFDTNSGTNPDYYTTYPTHSRQKNAITFEKGTIDYVYCYNNHLKHQANSITVSTATSADQYLHHFYIFNNLIEDGGYADYAYCYGIWISIEGTSYSVLYDNFHLWNNTIIASNLYQGIMWSFDGTVSNSTIKNNIIIGCNNAIRLLQQSGQTTYFNNSSITYNCFYDNNSDSVVIVGTINRTGTDITTANITSNPLLDSSYKISSTSSPVYHSGTDVGLDSDLDGNSWYSTPSRGCYEYEEEIIEGDPPVANFSTNVTSVYEGNTVTFTDLSTESPTSWSWTFGDSGTSTSQNPSHVYSTAGVYTVTLTATNAYGVDAEVKTNYITVTVPVVTPVADFTVDDTTIYEGQTVYFTDQTLNTPTSWSWNFGDGGTSTSQNPYHTYATAGSYTVNLTATNSSGSDTETKTNYIIVSAIIIAPVAQFTVNDTTIIEGESVSFTDQSTNSPVSWLWSFGDSTTSTSQNPSHIYSTSGTYTVTLTATNSVGSDVETKVDYITVSPAGYAPIASFYATSTTALVHSNIFFVDTSTNTPTSWYWDFGDGFNSANQHPSHQYNTSGVYTVSLTAYNAFGNDIETKTDYITIEEEPVGPVPSGCMTTFAKFYKVFVVPSIPPVSAFKFIFDDIGNAPVADPSSVSDWNTFLDLPTLGNPFTSVVVVGNEVLLYGGSNITIKDNLFYDGINPNTSLLGVEDHSNCTIEIGDFSFTGCFYLSSLILSSNLTSIGYASFALIPITRLIIPNSVTTVGESAFYGCGVLENIIFSSSMTTISESTFEVCYGVVNLIIPSNITLIENAAFKDCSSLETITILSNITSIGDEAFNGSSIIDTVNIYATTAPTVNITNTFADIIPPTITTLHISVGATGYDVAPWTNTAKFSSIVQDL